MRLKITLFLLALAFSAAAQDKALPADILAAGDKTLLIPPSDSPNTFDFFQQTIDINIADAPLSEVFKDLAAQLTSPPQVVFKGRAEEVTATANLRNVTLENFLIVLENLTDCKINIVDTDKSDNHPGIVFVESRSKSRPKTLPSSSPANDQTLGLLPPNHPTAVAAKKTRQAPITRTYSLSNLEKITSTEIVDSILLLWKSTDNDWIAKNSQRAFSVHEPTKTLIISAPRDRQEEASTLIKQLRNTYQNEEGMKREAAQNRNDFRVQEVEENNKTLKAEIAELIAQIQIRELEIVKLRARLETQAAPTTGAH